MKFEEMVGVVGKLVDVEFMLVLKDFFNRMGCECFWVEGDGIFLDVDLRLRFLFNIGIVVFE